MAFTTTDLSQAKQDALAKDAPLVLAKHALRDAAGTYEWRLSGSFTSGSAAAAAGFPTSRAHDGFHNLVTKPNASAVTWYFIIDFGASALQSIDSMFIGGHNFGTNSATVKLQIANASDFVAGLTTIATTTPSTNARIIELVLGNGGDPGPNVYGSLQFARLEITAAGGFTPEFAELVLSERTQLSESALVEYDPDWEDDRVSDFTARSGGTSRYVFFRGRAVRAGTFLSGDSTFEASIIEWWDETDDGTETFIWIEAPSSSATLGHVMLMESEFRFPKLHPSIRRHDFSMMEQPPFAKSEGL